MNNKNSYRVMKFLETVDKKEKSKGYVRLDIRGIKGTIMVSVENLGDSKSYSEVYLYKDKRDKIKLGDINNKKGMIKKIISFGSNDVIEDYNICGVVKDNKIVLFANLYNAVNQNDIKKLEADDERTEITELNDYSDSSVRENEQKEYQDQFESSYKTDYNAFQNNYNNSFNDSYFNDSSSNQRVDNEDFSSSLNDNIQYAKINNDDNDESYDNDQNDEAVYGQSRSERVFGDDSNVQAEKAKPKYINKFEENLYETLKNYEKVAPLSVNIKNLSWWKIPFDDRGIRTGFLPYYNQIISSYYPYPMTNRVTTCSGLMKKYGHYIFGVFEEKGKVSKFVYGVPGEFRREEQPYKGLSGFKNWSYKNKKTDGSYGYWLAFLDSTTGEVTEPPQIEVIK